jgi:hypothetical protein
MKGVRHHFALPANQPGSFRLYDSTGRDTAVTKDRGEHARIELEPMELRELVDFHEQWMRNPINRIRFCFARYRQMVREWLGWKKRVVRSTVKNHGYF